MSTIYLISLLAFIFVVSLCSLTAYLREAKRRKLVKVIQTAQVERDLENYQKSISLYESAINQDRKNSYLYFEYGEVKTAIKDYQGAIAAFSKAIALQPDYNEAYIRRAMAYLQVKDYRRVLEDCNQLINGQAPSSVPPGAYIFRGTVFIYFRKYEKALGEFNLALKLNPDISIGHTCRAEVYCYLGKYEQALESVKIALQLSPDFSINYLWRGWAKYGLSQFEEALEDCNRYIQEEQEVPKAFEVRGLIYKATNQFDQALTDLEEAAKLYKKEQLPSFYEEVCKHIQEIKEQGISDQSTPPSSRRRVRRGYQ